MVYSIAYVLSRAYCQPVVTGSRHPWTPRWPILRSQNAQTV